MLLLILNKPPISQFWRSLKTLKSVSLTPPATEASKIQLREPAADFRIHPLMNAV